MRTFATILVGSLFILAVVGSAQAATTYTWSGSAGGNWDNAANWGGGGYPVAGDTAIFNVAGANPVVTINGNQYADVVTLTGVGSSQALGNLTLAGTGTLTVTNSAPGTYLQVGMPGANNFQGLYGTATLHSDVSMAKNASLGGTLTIIPYTSVNAYGNIPVAFNPGQAAGTTHGTPGTLTVNGNVSFGSTVRQMNYDLSSTPGNSDLIAVGGTAGLNYVSAFNLFNSDGNFGPGTYPLMTYAGASLFNNMFVPNVGLYNPTITAPAGFTSYAYSLFDTGTVLQLLVGHKYTWAGAAGADWAASGNWTSPTGLTHPQTTDSATFAANSSVAINSPQSLATMTLAGAWAMSGSAPLTVTTIKGTGAMTINGGTLILNGQAISSGPTMTVASGGTLSGNGGTSYNGTTLQSGGTIAGSLVLGAFTATGGTITPGGPGAIAAFTTNSPSFNQTTFAYDLSVGNTTPAQGLSGLSNGYCNDYTCVTGATGAIAFGTSYLRVNPLPGFASSPGPNVYQIVDYSISNSMVGSGTVALTGNIPYIPGFLVGATAVDTDGTTGRKLTATFTRTAGATLGWTGTGGAANNWFNPANWTYGYVAPIAGDFATIDVSANPTIDLASLTAQTGASTFVTLAPSVGSVSLSNTGTLTLSNGTLNVTSPLPVGATQTLTGNATINAGTGNAVSLSSGGTLTGTMHLTGNLNSTGGRITPGNSIGTITIVGNVTLDHATVLNYELGAPNMVGGTTNDLIDITGALIVDGTLNITNAGGFGLGTYTLMNCTGMPTGPGLIQGTKPAGFSYGVSFTSGHLLLGVYALGDVTHDGVVNQDDIDAIYRHFGDLTGVYDVNFDGAVNQDDVTYELTSAAVGLKTNYGDANLDHKVNFSDFQVLLDHWQASGGTWATGDFNGDTVVNFGDFQKLLDYWNPAGYGAAVPEPTTLALLGLGALGLIRRKK